MGNYYFIGTLLPKLQLDVPPELDLKELMTLLKENLSEKDYQKALVLVRYFDIENIRSFWKQEPMNTKGSMNSNALEEALVTGTGFPNYVYDFLQKYENVVDRLNHFPELISLFFSEEIKKAHGFLKDYLVFERGLRLVTTGFRAKKLGKNLALELQYEDPYDPLVTQIFAQKDAKIYEPPSRFADLKVIFQEHENNPLGLAQALCEYRFHRIEEMIGLEEFTIDRILAYLAQLLIVKQWLELDKQKGLDVIKHIVQE